MCAFWETSNLRMVSLKLANWTFLFLMLSQVWQFIANFLWWIDGTFLSRSYSSKYSFLHSLAGCTAGSRSLPEAETGIPAVHPNSECRKVVLPCTTNGSDYCSCYCSCTAAVVSFRYFPPGQPGREIPGLNFPARRLPRKYRQIHPGRWASFCMQIVTWHGRTLLYYPGRRKWNNCALAVKSWIKAALDQWKHSNRSRTFYKLKLHINRPQIEAAACKRQLNVVFVGLNPSAC